MYKYKSLSTTFTYALLFFTVFSPLASVSEINCALQGLEESSIKSCFGLPDEEEGEEGVNRIYTYGETLIFTEQGKVSAWINGERLTKRGSLNSKSNQPVARDRSGWIND